MNYNTQPCTYGARCTVMRQKTKPIAYEAKFQLARKSLSECNIDV
jgi:hypothetical protein